MHERIGGIVLCGGQSKRMGQPKESLPFGNELLVQRVVRIVATVVRPVVVVGAIDQPLPPLPPDTLSARDRNRDRGPLEGLAAGLTSIREQGCIAAYVSATDVPFLAPGFVRQIVSSLGDADIAVPSAHQRLHPLAAAYRTNCLDAIERLLGGNRLRLLDLFDHCTTRVLCEAELRVADPSLESLRNVNTVQEYNQALCELAH